jgi:hypothetical protein
MVYVFQICKAITVTGLISFELNGWLARFQQWTEQELRLHPNNISDIRRWTDALTRLL